MSSPSHLSFRNMGLQRGEWQDNPANALSEREQAAKIADRLLDEPYADPDDDLRVLARQFNRSQEQLARCREALEKIIPLRGPGGDIAFVALHGPHK